MKILVADDELIMLESVCKILKQEEGLVLETARTGREAIEKAETFNPDLVIMDIKMPGINGLEALAEIRRLIPSAVFIILSAYDNFIYAQEAINLNVFSYLVKPINKSDLLQIINKAKNKIEQIKIERQKDLELRERYKKIIPFIESEFLHALVNGINRTQFYEYQKLLGFDFNSGFFLAISRREETASPNYEEHKYQVREYLVFLADKIRHLFNCFIGPLKTNPLTIFIPLTINPGEDAKKILENYGRKLLKHLPPGRIGQEIVLGIGEIYSDPTKIKQSYYEAFQALNNAGSDERIVCYCDLPKPPCLLWEDQLTSYFQEVWNALSFGNETKVQLLLDKLNSLLPQISEEHKDQLLFDLLVFYLTSYRIAKENYNFNLFVPSYKRISKIFQASNNLRKLFSLIAADIKLMATSVKESRQNSIKPIIREAKAIIDQNYQKHISLEWLADMVNVSSFYLSRLFKEELGESFSEYITRLRMEKTIQLLSKGCSVKECCFLVGYNDPNYFSRIFKKHFGIAPSDWVGKQTGSE
ncbi:MAG TPA: response regulator [Firmicutes bacterium]|jgi:two-component system response regulator YesN|nr:response regulator [Bacillota bacterium]